MDTIQTLSHDTELGVYRVTKAISAWKGFTRFCKKSRESKTPVARRVTIPRGAIVVVPRQSRVSKFRTNKIRIHKKKSDGVLYSPIMAFMWTKSFYRGEVTVAHNTSCARGFHFTLTRREALYWAGL